MVNVFIGRDDTTLVWQWHSTYMYWDIPLYTVECVQKESKSKEASIWTFLPSPLVSFSFPPLPSPSLDPPTHSLGEQQKNSLTNEMPIRTHVLHCVLGSLVWTQSDWLRRNQNGTVEYSRLLKVSVQAEAKEESFQSLEDRSRMSSLHWED